MSLDLVGKLHRTVYITDCPEDSQDDLQRMLMHKCHRLEAWHVAEGRITVVLASMNDVSNALSLHGLAFLGSSSKLCIWKATDPPPAEATQQLAIQGGQGEAAPSPADTAAAAEEEESRRVQRKERRAALQQMLSSGAQAYDTSSPEGRRTKLNELCRRQLKALCVLTAVALKDAKAELEEKRTNLERLQELIATRQKAAESAGVAVMEQPPTSRPRLEQR